MKLSTNSRYAIRILLELTEYDYPISISSISDKTGITTRSIENIHAILKEYDITTSTIGSKGGIQLKTPIENISLGEIILLFDDGIEFSVCCGDKSNDCPNHKSCEARTTWNTISINIQEQLNGISLKNILTKYRKNMNNR